MYTYSSLLHTVVDSVTEGRQVVWDRKATEWGMEAGLACVYFERETVSEAKLTSSEFPCSHPPPLLPVSQPTRGSSGLL